MTISISAGTQRLDKLVDVQIASPAERRTDDACAAQNSATESLSQGIARHRSGLDRLLDKPGPLDRFDPAQPADYGQG
jgi:hypothetical protein